MVTIRLPSMVAGRELADALVQAVTEDVTGQDVVLDCRNLVSASPSFVSELLRRVLDERGAARVVVRRPSDQLVRYLRQAATDLNVLERVSFDGPRAVPA